MGELIIRFSSFRDKRDAFRDSWFVFDTIMVVLNVFETWLILVIYAFVGSGNTTWMRGSFLRLLRLVRIARLARIARLMNAVPELMVLLKGIVIAGRAVSAVFVLLFFLIYVF